MAKNDIISLLPSPYKEKAVIVILRVTEQEMEETIPEILRCKVQAKRHRKKRNKRPPLIQNFTSTRNLNTKLKLNFGALHEIIKNCR